MSKNSPTKGEIVVDDTSTETLVNYEGERQGYNNEEMWYDVHVLSGSGDCNIEYYVVGKRGTPLETWILHDISISYPLYSSSTHSLELTHDWENLETRLNYLPVLRKWIEVANTTLKAEEGRGFAD